MALVLSVVLAVSSALALGPVSETIYRGIDVSVYQGDIDFHRVKEAGIEVVYIRAGEGSDYTDTYFEANAQKAKEAGLHFGFYLYVTARTEEQAREQARFFSDLIQNKEYTCRPAMDLEQFSGMSEERINEVGLAFLKELESLTGITPVSYTHRDVYKRQVSKARRDKRRSSHWKLETPGLVTCPKCGEFPMPNRASKA